MSHRKISNTHAVILVIVALFFDALSLIPILNPYVMVVGQIVIGLLFYAGQVNVLKSKPAVTYVLTTILEAMPAAGVLPFFFVETLTIIALARAGKA